MQTFRNLDQPITRKIDYRSYTPNLLLLMLCLALVGLSCGIVGGGDSEGDVGILFKNGVECLGENARVIEGSTLFVSPEGSDENKGTTREKPFLTLATALCNVRPGQTVEIASGTYRETVVLGLFGTSTAPIVFRGAPGASFPVLDGEGFRTMGIALVESTNITVENLTFRGYTDEGLQVIDGSKITIRNNRFTENGRTSIDPDADSEGYGVNVDGTRGVVIEDNEAWNNGPAPERVLNFTLGTGINTYEIYDAIIRRNHSHHNIGGGMLVEDSEDVLVEDNLIEFNELDANGDYWDGGIWIDGGKRIILRENKVSNNHGPGIVISDEDNQYPNASFGYVLASNTVENNLYGLFIWNFGTCPLPSSDILRLENNQIRSNERLDIWCLE